MRISQLSRRSVIASRTGGNLYLNQDSHGRLRRPRNDRKRETCNLMKYFLKLTREKQKIIIASLLPGLIIFVFIWTQPAIQQHGTIKVWDRNKTLLYEAAGDLGKKIPVFYEQIPQYLIDATIASEDNSFWSNPGVDIKAMTRSIYLNISSGKVISGASTITQQLARIAVISPRQVSSRNIFRKIREILIAFRLTLAYSKKQILTMYLNQMYYGNLAYGIQSAARTYFNKDVRQLSLAESAFLTGLLSSPDRRNPFTDVQEAKNQQFQVLDLMVKRGFISNEKADWAKEEQLILNPQGVDIKAPHFVQFILDAKDKLGIIASQGINIYTTLDYPTFLLSEDIAKSWVGKLSSQHDLTNAALILIKNNSGEIIDMLGGLDYFDAAHSGQVNMTTRARQPGSALKPVTYAAAFMQGSTPATLIYDVKKVYKTKKGEGFTPNNYDGRYHGLVLAREALASSLNLPAVEMLNRIGITNFLKLAQDLGITTFIQQHRYDLSLTLGGGEVKLIDLTNVFASFARAGNYKDTYAIDKITTDDGKILYQHKSEKETQVLGKNGRQVAYLISSILSDPKARILGFNEKNPLVLSHPAAVKTGTTTDWHDNWTIGYTPEFTAGVWVGNNDNQAMREITGVTGAAPIWNQFFEEFLKGKPTEQFIRPAGLKEVEICALSGKLPDGLCPEKTTELFIEGTEPVETSNLHKKIKIDKRNGLLAGESCSKDYVEERVMIDYPPEVYTWAAEEKLEIIPRQFSPLCNGDQISITQPLLEITYPKDKTVFENAPLMVKNQAIVFEVRVSPNINRISWYIDGVFFQTTNVFPFNISWPPVAGKHKIEAVGQTLDGKTIKSNDVQFTVVDYKDSRAFL